MMIRGILFDVDGTLIDSVDAHAQSWTETLEEFGVIAKFADVRYQIGKGGDQLMKEFLSDSQIKDFGKSIEAARKASYVKNYLPKVRAFPQTRELFQRIREEAIQVVLASSAGDDEISTYKELAGITDLVAGETSKDDVEKSKPHPDIFEAAFASLSRVQKDEVIVVGDSPWDAISAQRAGLRTIGLRCGGFPEKDLREAGCVAIYQDPADLLAHFAALSRALRTSCR